jgi:excisionase family DNA binding protein
VNEQPQEYTMKEVCKRLRKHRHYVTDLIISGKLKARKEGREWRIAKVDLDAYIASTQYQPPGTT